MNSVDLWLQYVGYILFGCIVFVGARTVLAVVSRIGREKD
jgi:hypothetical protein